MLADDDLDILEALVHANRQRVKTDSQLTAEVNVLDEVQRERAKRRQALAGTANFKQFQSAPTSSRDITGTGGGLGSPGEMVGALATWYDRLHQVSPSSEDGGAAD